MITPNPPLGPISEVIAHHSKSFHLASRLLDPTTRRRVEILYAWCRLVDDSIDHAPDSSVALHCLQNWRHSLSLIYSGQPLSQSLDIALRQVIFRCELPREHFDDLLLGMEMDIKGMFAPSEKDLITYCYRVAGVVGLMMARLMGAHRDSALQHATHLGMGMQLINIARDVLEDWHKGRLYIPKTWLTKLPEPGEPLCTGIFQPAVEQLLDWADVYLHSGRMGLTYLTTRNRLAVSVATEVYAAIGEEIRKRGCDISTGRAVVSWPRKIQKAIMGIVQALSISYQQKREKRSLNRAGLCNPVFDSSLIRG